MLLGLACVFTCIQLGAKPHVPVSLRAMECPEVYCHIRSRPGSGSEAILASLRYYGSHGACPRPPSAPHRELIYQRGQCPVAAFPGSSLHRSSSNKQFVGSCWEPGWVLNVLLIWGISTLACRGPARARATDASCTHPHPLCRQLHCQLPALVSPATRVPSALAGGWGVLQSVPPWSSPQPVSGRSWCINAPAPSPLR